MHYAIFSLSFCGMCALWYRLAFPHRIYYIYASTEEEVNDWVELLQWKLVRSQVSSMLDPPWATKGV